MVRPQVAIALIFLVAVSTANASVEKIQGRFFGGLTTIKPETLNTELTNQSLKTFDSIWSYGVEVTYPVTSFLEPGIRYTRRTGSRDETSSNVSTEYEATIAQDSIVAVLRIPLIKAEWFRFDIFGGYGTNNTSVELNSSSQNGKLSRKAFEGDAETLFGASVGFGYNRIYITLEGGLHTNKINSWTKTGNTNIQEVDLSGSYGLISLMFDGGARAPGK